jgi:hypothetical protein
MRNTLRFAGLCAVAALSLTALAIQDAITLKRVAKVGDVAKYRMQADIEYQGSAVSFKGLVTDKVTKVADDGQYSVESTTTEGKVSFAGAEHPTGGQTATATTTIYKPSGEIVSVISEQSDPNFLRLANLQALHFSANPVKVGDSWEVTIAKSEQGAVEAKGTCKLEIQEKIGERDTYRIHAVLKETIEKEPAAVDATYWIDVKDGSLVKLTGTFTNAPFPAPIGAVTAKITLTRE